MIILQGDKKKTKQPNIHLSQSAARTTPLERGSTVSVCQFMPPLFPTLWQSALPEDLLTQALCTDEMKLEQRCICKRVLNHVGSSRRLQKGQKNRRRSTVSRACVRRVGLVAEGVKVVLFRRASTFSMDADWLSLNWNRSIHQQKDSLGCLDLRHLKYPSYKTYIAELQRISPKRIYNI